MTQLARPDLARNRSGRDHVRPGPALATTEPWPADRSGLLRAGRPVPGWAVGTAMLAPVVLVAGWLIACALPADPDWPFHSRYRRHSGTGHRPDVAPPRLRGELRRHDSGLARTCRQARAAAIVDPQCLRLRDGDGDLRRVVLLAPDRRPRRRR